MKKAVIVLFILLIGVISLSEGSVIKNNGIYTYYTDKLGWGEGNKKIEIGRIIFNQFHWTENGSMIFEIFSNAYGYAGYAKFHVYAGYEGTGEVEHSKYGIEPMEYRGPINGIITIGEVVKSGVGSYGGYPNYYLPVYLETNPYWTYSVKITSPMNDCPDFSQASVGQFWFNKTPVAVATGTLNPNYTIKHSTTNVFDGNVGIGTNDPSVYFGDKNLKIATPGRPVLALEGGDTSLTTIVMSSGKIDGSNEWHINGTQNQLTLWNNGQNLFNFSNNGYMGIGTAEPQAGLHIYGDKYTLYGPNSTWGEYLQVGGNGRETNRASVVASNGNLHIDAKDGNFATYINWHSNNNTFINGNGGNVGIGTTNPVYKLSVNGTVGAKEVVVTQANWADFVFEPDYKLKTLPEVEAYIAANKRLPDMPSEAEVKEKGANIGDVQAKLLQKIEELTLYVIEQEKRNAKQDERIKALEEENKKLKISK